MAIEQQEAMGNDTPQLEAPQVEVARRSARGVLPVVVLVLMWTVYWFAGQLEVASFFQFLGRAAAVILAMLVFTVWWLWRGPSTFGVRALVVVGVIGCVAVSIALMHRTVMPPLILIITLPGMLTGWILWTLFSRRLSGGVQCLGLVVVAVLAGVAGASVRMEGTTGSGGDFYWRWQRTAEDQFLEQLASRGTTAQPVSIPDQSASDGWTEFRGSNRDATIVGTRIETDWGKSTPQLQWTVAVGPGWSSMVVVGNALYTQEQRGDIEVVSCYDANTGEQRWVHEDEGRFEENIGGVGPRATPTFHEGRIYARSARGLLNCLDASTGEVIWNRPLTKDLSATVPIWGFSDSPLIVDDLVVVFAAGQDENHLIALSAESGEQKWAISVGIQSYSSAQPATIAGQRQLLFIGSDRMVACDPATGEELWEFKPKQSPPRTVVQPRIIDDESVLVSFSPIDGLYRLAVTRNGDSWNVSETWKTTRINPDYSDFVHYEDHIYGFDGNIFCSIDLATGERNWKRGRYGSGQVLLFADQGVLLVLTEQGELVLLEARPDQHNELARIAAIDGKTWNHPVLVGDRLYVRNGREMACFELPVR